MINLFGGEKYTTEELNARLKFFIGIVLGLTLFGIVFVVLYSLIFVTQPMNGMSPVDNKFFELIIPIATFLTGTLSGIMLAGDDKELRGKAIDAANKGYTPTAPSSGGGFGGGPKFGTSGGFSASGSIGGTNFSFNKPAAAPSAGSFTPAPGWGTTPVAASVATSSTGKPMPVQDDEPEL
jgi:hypothetical protein